MKTVWLWISAAVLIACGTPERGAERHYAGAAGGKGGSSPDGGTVGRLTCSDVVCDPNATCSGIGNAARCTCRPGFVGNGKTCADIDECNQPLLTTCGENADCIEKPGSFLCKCKDGFLGDGTTCTAVNPCQGTANSCDPNAVCADAKPVSCTCKPGFTAQGAGCADLDECADPKLFACAAHAACVNTFGAYGCACLPGFAGDGNASCKALCDAAKADASVCAARGVCRVDGERAVCDACTPGFTGTGKTCTATQCATGCDGVGTDDSAHAVCTAAGTCACAPGYAGAPGSCTDVDECGTNNGGCGEHMVCTNTDGGHLCACGPGYGPDGTGKCVDMDECAAKPGPCHPDATCANREPDAAGKGYSCTCKPGFAGDGAVCEDIDECRTKATVCATNATCVNRRGSADCECQAPLTGDPSNCHCDLSGLWAMRQDVSTCWKALPIQAGTAQDLVSEGAMEATVWELHELSYDGSRVSAKKKGCGADNTPDLISPLFHETYSSYVAFSLFDSIDRQAVPSFARPGLVPGSRFTTPSEAAVIGIDLGKDPLKALWPLSQKQVAASQWLDADGDGEPGMTLWPRLPSQKTDSGGGHYSYIPARPGIGGATFYIEQRAGCVSVAARVITHLEATVQSCTRIIGTAVNEKTEGRVHSCMLVDKGGACNPNDLNDCPGWKKDVTCNASDWQSASARCSDQDLIRLDDDRNQAQASVATFELVRVGAATDPYTCADVRKNFPPFARSTPLIACTTPP